MNTKQNYVGGGDIATQTAQNEGQTSSSVGNQQPNQLVESHFEELHSLISNFLNEAGASGPIELLNELMLSDLHSALDLDELAGPCKQYSISQATVDRILDVTQLTNFLVSLSEKAGHISRLRSKALAD